MRCRAADRPTASASWKHKGVADKMENVVIAVRVNKGQGADATLGKAKRKLLARIYARVTGTVVTDGDVGDPEAIPVETTKVSSTPEHKAPDGLSEDQKAKLKDILADELDARAANEWLRAKNFIPQEGTFLDMKPDLADRIIAKPKDFLSAAHAGAKKA